MNVMVLQYDDTETENILMLDVVDDEMIHGQVGMLHLSIAGQIRQLAQIAEITHKMACQTCTIASALPQNAIQRQRGQSLRRVTAELKRLTDNMTTGLDSMFY